MSADAALLLDAACRQDCSAIVHTLNRFGGGAVDFAHRCGIRIVPLHRSERYDDRSAALRRLSVNVDAWPAPPAGLFVVEERTVYLRSRSPMTVAHEFGHALDCALGEGVYRSSTDPVLRASVRAGAWVCHTVRGHGRGRVFRRESARVRRD